MARRESFKGNKKNRNKKISKEDRRLIHTKKKSKRGYDVKTIARDTLEGLRGAEVVVEATLKYMDRKSPLKPVLVTDVIIDGIHYDHLWIEFGILDRRKLKLCVPVTTILFTGVVHQYSRKNDRQVGLKYGVKSVNLVKSMQ